MTTENRNKDLVKRIADHIQNKLPEDPLLITGVSGGADSMLLMYLLSEIGIRSFISHINYGKRVGESDKEQELVEQMAFEWGFECHTVNLDPAAVRGNFQNWARDQRYEIFMGLMQSEKADAIAVAHHKDDQTETLIQKIFRGSSLSSWSAMKIWDPPLFRPMLGLSKEEILRFCEDHAIPYLTDSSNQGSDYARNWLRNEWFEEMDRLFPGWRSNLERIEMQARAFDEGSSFILKQVAKDGRISDRILDQFGDPLKGEVWRKMLHNNGFRPSYGQIDEILKLQDSQPGTSITMGNLRVIRERDGISLKKETSGSESVDRAFNREQFNEGFEFQRYHFRIQEQEDPSAGLWLSTDDLTFPLRIRNWQPGDRFRPFGMRGHQKVSDHLTNRKVSGYLKDRALVLCEEDGTIVALLYPEKTGGQIGCIDDRFKTDEETLNYLIIRTDL